jgi:hypothetical protein
MEGVAKPPILTFGSGLFEGRGIKLLMRGEGLMNFIRRCNVYT